MKILRSGSVQQVLPHKWWHGKQETCLTCGCTLELEKGDKVTIVSEDDISNLHVDVECPTFGCSAVISIFP